MPQNIAEGIAKQYTINTDILGVLRIEDTDNYPAALQNGDYIKIFKDEGKRIALLSGSYICADHKSTHSSLIVAPDIIFGYKQLVPYFSDNLWIVVTRHNNIPWKQEAITP